MTPKRWSSDSPSDRGLRSQKVHLISVSGPERTTALRLAGSPDRPSRKTSLSSVAESKCHSSHAAFVYLWSETRWRSAARSKFHPSPSPLFASSRLLIHLRGWRRLTARRMPLRPGAVDGGSTVNKGDRGSIRHIQSAGGGSHLQATVETDARRSSHPAGVPAIPAHPGTDKGEWQEGVSVGRTVWVGVALKTSCRCWSIRVYVFLEIIWKWSC